jgi:hypothetical protein
VAIQESDAFSVPEAAVVSDRKIQENGDDVISRASCKCKLNDLTPVAASTSLPNPNSFLASIVRAIDSNVAVCRSAAIGDLERMAFELILLRKRTRGRVCSLRIGQGQCVTGRLSGLPPRITVCGFLFLRLR